MNTLSEQLTELYNEKWSDLMEQLEANGLRNKLQCPFLISVLRSGQKKEEREKEKNFDPDWHSKQTTPGHEEWYTKADIKIMFFGQEPHGWEKDMLVIPWQPMKISLTTNMLWKEIAAISMKMKLAILECSVLPLMESCRA